MAGEVFDRLVALLLSCRDHLVTLIDTVAAGRRFFGPQVADLALQALVDATVAKWGQIDHLVCNAASNPYYGPQGGISDEAFTKILQNNIVSNHWLIQLAAPGMIERKDGAIIVISSLGATRGSAVST